MIFFLENEDKTQWVLKRARWEKMTLPRSPILTSSPSALRSPEPFMLRRLMAP